MENSKLNTPGVGQKNSSPTRIKASFR